MAMVMVMVLVLGNALCLKVSLIYSTRCVVLRLIFRRVRTRVRGPSRPLDYCMGCLIKMIQPHLMIPI